MRRILPWISVNNTIVSQEEASISILDDGFQYGYGFFTTLKVREGIPLFFEKHIDRLEKSAFMLSLTLPKDCFTYVRNDVEKIIGKNERSDGAIRITVTKGVANQSSVVIHATTIDPEIHTVPVITVPDQRDIYKTVKMTYRVPHIIAMQKAQEQGAQDALFTLDTALIESTYANIYSFVDGHIVTPPMANKGLNGISRQVLMEKLPIQEKEIPDNTNNPMVLVSSLSIRVVEKINGRVLKQNPSFTSTIQKAIDTAENEYLAAHKK